ncbi:MAG: alpha/beta hydrolase [Rhodospirillales bacterium]|nr:alpha/beta hydrolase [Rhodospirillales bacterium]MDP6644082.1 alpha/beta hydrolase [Rhodospirillales bacterium]MDP6841134.1 alpha/beta hydrolase [Rhodospirillales bacterium]
MAKFVLIHGAWEAGWVWDWMAPRLRDAGHEVHTPSLTGLGARSHLLTPDVNLETHVLDVLGVLEWGRLENVTLVGHSYGGAVVTGVADRAPERIGSLIYLDAFVPKDGQSLTDLQAPERAKMMRKYAEDKGEGWYLPPFPADFWHVTNPEEAAFLEELSTPHPYATMLQKLQLTGGLEKIAKKTYVQATGYEPSAFPRFVAEAREAGWPVEELNTHHFTMLSMPAETAEVLIRHAA